MNDLMVWDWLRGVTLVSYVVLVAQTLATVFYYLRARRNEHRSSGVRPVGVLPSHVIDVGIVLIVFAGEAVWLNVSRIGEPFTWYAVVNPLLLLFANRAVLLISRYEGRRYALSRPRPRLPMDR